MNDDWDKLQLQISLNCGILMAGLELAELEEKIRRNARCRENFRMAPEIFDELYNLLEPHLLRKRNTRPNDFIPEKAKLAIVIEYLASGEMQRHFASCYRISNQHFGRILAHVCGAICAALKNQIPEWTEETLRDMADGFRTQWDFPNCVAAIDGKHVGIKAPVNSGSIFYNYKGFHSIVLMATCDAFYRFTYLDVGAYGSEGDSNIMKNSKFGVSVVNDTCPFPPDSYIDGKKVPHFIVGGDAFPLCKRVIKTFKSKPFLREERIFNYSLTRARRCIENTFGILSARWLCLRKILFCSPDRAQIIVSACCLLHNFLMKKTRPRYCSNNFSGFEDSNKNWVPGEWETIGTSMMQNDLNTFRGRSADYGKYVRNILKEYVNSKVGSVPWQDSAAFK